MPILKYWIFISHHSDLYGKLVWTILAGLLQLFVDAWVTYNQLVTYNQFQEILGRLTNERINEKYFHNRGY